MKVDKAMMSAVVLIAIGVVSIVYAGYRIYSNKVYVTVSTYALTIEPSANFTVTRLENVTFTATLTKDGARIPNALIELRKNEALVASNYTISDGTCQLTYNVTEEQGSLLEFHAEYFVP
jgi:hypothetical protein